MTILICLFCMFWDIWL